MSTTKKMNQENLMKLANITDPNAFEKKPSGYSKRERASLLQLCLSPIKAVRMECAKLPLLRDMFIIAMYEQEQDKKVKAVLQERYDAATSTANKYETLENKLAAAEARIAELEA